MFKVTLLPGDGIGPEVIDSAVKVLKYAVEKFIYRKRNWWMFL